ncbi:hypothetical protein DBW61_02285 [bacterium]|nr:MAG: hypothetical protein DBW61_02285 [bacterium]
MKNGIITILFFASFIFPQSLLENIAGQAPIWTGSFGTVVIDGDIYNQISMRPEFNYRNWGMGFDLYFYIDSEGKLYDETWRFDTFKNTYRTLLDKFRYVRYGYPGDQFYLKAGTLSNISVGSGILVSNYSNAMEYPAEKKLGLQVSKYLPSGIGIEYIQSDFRKTPGLASLSLDYPITSDFNLTLSVITDINQTGALDDSDNDQVPDFIDDFPNNEDYAVDTDGDGIADTDPNEFDIDGDGFDYFIHLDNPGDTSIFTDNFPLDIDGIITNRKQRLTYSDLKESVTGLGLDLTYHINQNFKFYSEFGQLFSSEEYLFPNSDESNWSLGYGFTPIGFRGHYGPFSFKTEYRQNSRHFIYNFWDRTYELNRATVRDFEGNQTVETKAAQLYKYGKLSGLFFDFGASILNLVNLGISYQDLTGEIWDDYNNQFFENQKNRSFIASFGINTGSVPKLKYLNGFYQRSNVRNPFDFENPDKNTIYGYNLGIDISESMVLVYKARYSYKFDGLDVDGNINYKQVYSMFVETQVMF